VTPAQSLDLLNNDLVLDWARAFAGRVLNDGDQTPDAAGQVDRAFRLAFGRRATSEDQKMAAAFLERQQPIMTARLTEGAKATPPMPTRTPEGMNPARAAAFVDLCQMLLTSNEFL